MRNRVRSFIALNHKTLLLLSLCLGVGISAVVASKSTAENTKSPPDGSLRLMADPSDRLVRTGLFSTGDVKPALPLPGCNSGWVNDANLPASLESLAVASDGVFVYSAGGAASGVATNALYRYDPVADSWSTLATLPAALYAASAAYAANTNSIYVFGGFTPGVLNTTYRYNIGTNAWTTVAAMPGPRYHSSVAYDGVNGKIYVVGGFDGAISQNQTWEYDPVANTWNTTRANIPTAVVGSTASISGQFIYIAGGNGGSTLHYRYDVVGNAWTAMAPVPVGVNEAAGGNIGGNNYLVGGGNPFRPTVEKPGPAATFTTTYIYNIAGNSWSTGPTTNFPHSFAGGAAVGTKFVVVAGYNGTVDTNKVESLETAPCADLSINKTDGVSSAIPGTSVTYTIIAQSTGPATMTGATVADVFPAGFITSDTWTCVGSGGGTCPASGSGNINASVTLPSAGVVTFTVIANISPSAVGAMSNTATITPPAGAIDPNLANNTFTDTDTLTPTADLSITKNDGHVEATPGLSTTYTITASNAGPSTVTGATVTDVFPAGFITSDTWTCVGSGGGTCPASGNGNINASVNLPVGGTATFTVIANISAAAAGTMSNTATITPPAGTIDPNLANNTATDTDTLVPTADVSITKSDGVTTVTPGQTDVYTIVAANSGPSNTFATVADTFPAIFTGATWTCSQLGGASCGAFAGSGNINNLVSLPVGGSVTYVVTGTVAAGSTGSLVNTATATVGAGVTDPTPANNSATDTDQIVVSISGNIKLASTNANLANVPVNLSGTTSASTTTDANGNFTFTGLPSGGNFTVTPLMAGEVFDPLSRTFNGLTTNITNANFLAFATGTLGRDVRLLTSFVTPGQPVTVPVVLTALGNEMTVSFSISNEFYLFNPVVSCGASDPGCTILTSGGGNSGALGITVTPASQLAAGQHEIARVTYQTLGNIPPTVANSPLTMTDSPTARSVTDAANNPLFSTFTGANVVFAQSLEGDLATRNTGDGQLLANDLILLRQFVVGTLTPNPAFNEFQRADVAPRASFGDGQLNAGDITQERRYIAGLDPLTAANGPGGPLASPSACNQGFDSVTAPNLPTGWTTSATGAESPWTTTNIGADAGTNAAFAPDPAGVGNTELVSPIMNVPPGGNPITFRNSFDLETGYDGMVLEISINNGPFTDILAAGGSFAAGGYNGTLSNSFGNPLGGRSAWTGNSGQAANNPPSYITTVVNLPASANGQEIRLKWRVGTDSSVSGFGARIDSITNSACSLALTRPSFEDSKHRQIRATASDVIDGKVSVAVDMNARGDEAAASFTLNYDASKLANPVISLGSGVTDGVLTTNVSKASSGSLGILVDSGQAFTGRELVVVTFDVVQGAGGVSPVYFSDDLAPRSVSDPDGNMLDTGYGGTELRLAGGGSAQLAEVLGRLLTQDGLGLRNVTVVLADQQGNVITTTTSSFGYYHFTSVPVGEGYTLSVQSKRYHFDSRIIGVTSALNDLDLIAR